MTIIFFQLYFVRAQKYYFSMKLISCSFSPMMRLALQRGNIINKISYKYLNIKKCISTSSNIIRYAQATPTSHPHLLKLGEINPGLTAEIYRNRRQKMIEIISKSNHSESETTAAHLVVIPSGSLLHMSESIPYSFRQNTDFMYLCGFKEPNSVLVLTLLPGKLHYESTLFITKPTPHSEKWEGPKMDLSTVTNFLGIDRALYLDDFEKFLGSFATSSKHFTLWYEYTRSSLPRIHGKIQDLMKATTGRFSVESSRVVLHKLRVIKCNAEAQLMRDTCKIAAHAMKDVIKFSRGGIPEAHLLAKMDYECRMRGANHLSFPPVVAGGDRANTIHYIDCNNIVEDGDMVLMDAGCEFHGYSSDISRTWPINGKFTDPQREVYQAVLAVQEEMIRLCQTKMPLDHIFEIMCKSLGKEFQALGVIPKSATEEQLKEAGYELCPHHVGHYLGMDVHDTDLISRSIRLQTGMVVTIEPGVYISKNNTKYPEKYRGLCVRIEDDVLITDEGYEVLTADCPKQIDQIENMFKKS